MGNLYGEIRIKNSQNTWKRKLNDHCVYLADGWFYDFSLNRLPFMQFELQAICNRHSIFRRYIHSCAYTTRLRYFLLCIEGCLCVSLSKYNFHSFDFWDANSFCYGNNSSIYTAEILIMFFWSVIFFSQLMAFSCVQIANTCGKKRIRNMKWDACGVEVSIRCSLCCLFWEWEIENDDV